MKKVILCCLLSGILLQSACNSEKELIQRKKVDLTNKNGAMIDGEQLLASLEGKFSTAEIQKHMAVYCQSKGYIGLFEKKDMIAPLKSQDLLDVTTDLAAFIKSKQ